MSKKSRNRLKKKKKEEKKREVDRSAYLLCLQSAGLLVMVAG